MKLIGGVFAGLLVAVLMAFFIFSEKVPVGYTGVIVNTMGSDKGIQQQETGIGRKFLSWNEDLYMFPTFNQNVNYEKIVFQDKNGMEVSAPIGMTLRAAPGAAPLLYANYRKGMDEIININVTQVLRTAFNSVGSKLGSEEMYGKNQDTFLKEVYSQVSRHFADKGLIIESMYLNGKLDLPKSVVDTITAQVQATQKTIQRQNEVAQVKAEAEKQVAQAQGEKDSAILKAEGEAQSLAIRGKALRDNPGMVELNAIDKWDGKLPMYMTGGQALPFINVK